MVKPTTVTHPALKYWLLLIFGLTHLSLNALPDASPATFYGFWETQEEIGDKCILNIKRGGRASCFYAGSASTKITKGRWELIDDRLVITWETGYRDALSVDTASALKREVYNVGSELNHSPDYVAQAYRVDSRIPGSLTRSSPVAAEEAEEKQPAPFALAPPVTKDPAMQAPGGAMRNPFVGYWEVEQSPGGFFGLMTANADRFYLFLDRNGQASVSLRKTKSKDDTKGIWEYTGGSARITWPSGRKDILKKEPNGFQLTSLRKRDDFDDKPESTREARQITAAEAARFFNAGDVRRITMTDLVGLWVAADPQSENIEVIRILGWGNAELLVDGRVEKSGKWKILNDRSLITWADGTRDVLRDEFRWWTRSSYSPNQDVGTAPLERFIVVKRNENELEATTAR